ALFNLGTGRWEHQRLILVKEFGSVDVVTALAELPAMAQRIATEVERSKRIDDERGQRIFSDYATVHEPAREDKIVRNAWSEFTRLSNDVAELILSLDGSVRTNDVQLNLARGDLARESAMSAELAKT